MMKKRSKKRVFKEDGMDTKEKQKIFDTLNEHLKQVRNLGINDDRILGIFLYGSQNYGTNKPTSDIDSKVIVLPSFEDFCLQPKNIYSKELETPKGEHINVKDIRIYRDNILKQNINSVETLFTEFYILNPKYEQLFNEYLINNRENISKINRSKAVMSIGHQAIHTLSQKLGDAKKFYNAVRLLYFLEDYVNDIPYMDCLQQKGVKLNHLMSLRSREGKDTISEEDINSLIKMFKDLMEKYKNLPSPRANKGLLALDTGVIEILKHSFRDSGIDEEEISKKEFFSKLTNAEERAYYSIINEIGDEGNVTIAKLVDEHRISRPVYNNLLAKLKEHDVAEVINMGAKGTYIKVIQTELKAEAMNF